MSVSPTVSTSGVKDRQAANGRPEYLSADEKLLASMGYKQELKRDFTPLEVFGLSFSFIGILPSVGAVLVYAIPNGGASAMVWGWATCSVFLMMIAMSMAELGSSAPTVGGIYFWTFSYSSPKYRRFLSWLVGYTNTIAYISATASVDWGLAVQVMAAVSIGSDMTFTPTVGQTFGVFCATLLCHAVLTSLATKVIARLHNIYIGLNVVLALAIIIALPITTPKEYKNTASYAFGDFQNLSGWPNGYAFIISFLAPLWVVGGFDTSLHVSEEARNAAIAVPWAILGAVSLGSVLGWALNVVLAFNMGTDLDSILFNPIGQPLATILFNSFGKRGTLVVWSFIIVAQFMVGNSTLTAASRQTWAFSRDGALPFSGLLYRVNPYTSTPVNAVWFVVGLSGLLGLLAFAGQKAIGAIFSPAVVGHYISYSIPIAARFLGGKKFIPGPFSLGVFSLPVAVISVTWMTFMWIVLLFPSTPGATANDMNYTVVVLGGTLVLSVGYYYFPKYGGINWFEGPIANVVVDDGDSASTEKEKLDEK